MFPDPQNARLRILARLFFLCGLILAAASSPSAHALVEPPQAGRNLPPVPDDQQRAQQYDQRQQQQDQAARDQALGRAYDDIHNADARAQQEALDRARLQALLRDNFRHHYKTLRSNSDKLVQLTLDLQAQAGNGNEAGLPRDTLAQAAAVEKLAHEIRTTMAGRGLPRMKPSSQVGNTAVASPTPTIDARQLLLQRTNTCVALAATLKQATEQYLANDNEQAVSVDALKKTADKTQIDPHLVLVMNASLQLERIAHDLRTLTPVLLGTPEVSDSR